MLDESWLRVGPGGAGGGDIWWLHRVDSAALLLQRDAQHCGYPLCLLCS